MKKLRVGLTLFVFLCLELVMDCISPFTKVVAVIGLCFGTGKFKQWGYNSLYSLDTYRSAQTGGGIGSTISGRLGSALLAGSPILSFIARQLDFVTEELTGQKNHSVSAIDKDKERTRVTGR